MTDEISIRNGDTFRRTQDLDTENIDEEVVNINQAVTKDLTSSSKFSGSCVLTLQTLPIVFQTSHTVTRSHTLHLPTSESLFGM